MKFRITFKDPDGVSNCLREAANESFRALAPSMTEEELEGAIDMRYDAMLDALGKWIKWGEYITIEFDPIAKTATVIETNK